MFVASSIKFNKLRNMKKKIIEVIFYVYKITLQIKSVVVVFFKYDSVNKFCL